MPPHVPVALLKKTAASSITLAGKSVGFVAVKLLIA
jgi:hypothetical protein